MQLLLVSNGHGEDLSAALLGKELRQRGVKLTAVPLVGDGDAYRRAELAVAGRTRSYSTGGLGYTSFTSRVSEILTGQVLYLLQRSLRLWREARRADGLVVVGDVIPVLLAWLCGRPVVTYLVAYSSHYEGKLRLPWPCGACLASRRFRAVFSRDALSAADLSQQLARPVQFLGNPFMETVLAATATNTDVLLLPGSRLPEAAHNLELMLQLLERLPAQLAHQRLRAALVPELSAAAVQSLASARGWQSEAVPAAAAGTAANPGLLISRGNLLLELHWQGFAALLKGSQVVVSMAGTATEQAVGLGKPVLQLAGAGPQFTAGFAEAQRRLLGPAVHCAEGAVGASSTLDASAALLQALLQLPEQTLAAYRLEGERRLGQRGGIKQMAEAIVGAFSIQR
jgi:uncharacterized protein (TIGR03492 family)